jgi:hypothetical protein
MRDQKTSSIEQVGSLQPDELENNPTTSTNEPERPPTKHHKQHAASCFREKFSCNRVPFVSYSQFWQVKFSRLR